MTARSSGTALQQTNVNELKCLRDDSSRLHVVEIACVT